MPPLPLFTKAELQAGFALILPPEAAANAADDWWEMIADAVDPQGYFLYHQDPAAPERQPANALAVGIPGMSPADLEAQERLCWGNMSLEDRREILLRFSNFHFRLLGLVSLELFERMRRAEGISLASAERGRTQMRRIVAAIQSGPR